jgi:hypothetical protein
MNRRVRLPASRMVGDRRMFTAAATPTNVSIARDGGCSFKAFLARKGFSSRSSVLSHDETSAVFTDARPYRRVVQHTVSQAPDGSQYVSSTPWLASKTPKGASPSLMTSNTCR